MAIELGAIAPGGASTLVAGIAGQRIYLHEMEIAPDAVGNNFVELYASSTPAFHLWQAEFNQLTPRRFGGVGGIPLPIGDGLVIRNDAASAGNVNLRGTIAYSQG